MQDERGLEGRYFARSSGAGLPCADWELWACAGPEFAHEYDRDVVLVVQRGAAELRFADGTQVALQAGDCLRIKRGASAVWAISAPIENRYRYGA